MGHQPPTSVFTWPVPPEELAGVPVLIIECGADGRITVRHDPAGQPDPQADVVPPPRGSSLDARARFDQGRTAPLSIGLAWPSDSVAIDARGRQRVRDRATWLGIGAVLGLTLAASTIPDSSRVSTTRLADVDALSPSSTGPLTRATPMPGVPPSAAAMAPALLRTLPASPAPTRAVLSDGRAGGSSGRAAGTGNAVGTADRASSAQRAGTSLPAAATPRAGNAARPRPPQPPPVTGAVLQEVRRYEAAYTRMDASALQAIWPTADRPALVRHFTGLREQRLRLDRCIVEAPGETASATCRGTLLYRPRVGDHSTRTQRGLWRFALERGASGWVLADVQMPVGNAPGTP